MKIKRLISIFLILSTAFSVSIPAFAAGQAASLAPCNKSVTIYFNYPQMFSASDHVQQFFEENNLDYTYYMNWLAQQDVSKLEKVTFTISHQTYYAATRSSSVIKGSRIVYADQFYNIGSQSVQFSAGQLVANVVSEVMTFVIGKYSKSVASLASILGITNPSNYFGSSRVQIGKDYCEHEVKDRIVTKFVELYAPVSGTTKWYAWGYAQSDYVYHGFRLFYKGVPKASAELYEQYYTQNYYNVNNLINLVKNAYPTRTYQETADSYAATIGGYALHKRDINKSTYYEYDNLCP